MSYEVEAQASAMLVTHLPRTVPLAFQSESMAAYERAAKSVRGHFFNTRAGNLGIARHRELDIGFVQVLQSHGISHSGLRTNQIVVARCGKLDVVRVSRHNSFASNARRSSERRNLAVQNLWLERLGQPDFFGPPLPGSRLLVMLNNEPGCDGFVSPHLELIVPSADLRGILFRESAASFLQRYARPVVQADRARPVLRAYALKTNPLEAIQ